MLVFSERWRLSDAWASAMKFSEAIEEFLQFCRVERQLSHYTIQAYTADLHDFWRFLPAETAVVDVTQETLTGYLRELAGERGLAPASVRRRFACLRVFFRRIVKRAACVDPFVGFELKLVRRKRLPRALSRSEAGSLVGSLSRMRSTSAQQSDLATVIGLMICTGIRVGELCKLRIEDVSPDGCSIRIHGKGCRDRMAYIADQAVQADLTKLVQWSRASGSQGRLLFRNRCGAPISPQSIRSRLRRKARSLGLARRITPHMLRHTAATLLIEEGVDIRFVQRLLGHSSIATTEIYTHVSDEALKARLQKADVLRSFSR
jgi:integrase/recombinase XerD